jgi:hypothetical protein
VSGEQDKGKTVLTQIDCIRLVMDKITDFVNMPLLRACGLIEDSFPLHHRDKLDSLKSLWNFHDDWSICKSWKLTWKCIVGQIRLTFREPIPYIREYFGEEVALYFVFTQSLAQGTLLLAAMDLVFWLFVQDEHLKHALHAIFAIIWFRAFTQIWRQTEEWYAEMWGISMHQTSGLKALINPRFSGTDEKKTNEGHEGQRRDHEEDFDEKKTNEDHEDHHGEDLKLNALAPHVDDCRRNVGFGMSQCVTGLFIILVLVIVAAEQHVFLGFHQRCKNDLRIFTGVMGVFSGVQIFLFDAVWGMVVKKITDWECIDEEHNFRGVLVHLGDERRFEITRLQILLCA